MPTFHTLDEALKYFNEKFYSISDKTCLWHRNVDLRQFLSLVWQSAKQVRNRELAEKVEKWPNTYEDNEEAVFRTTLKEIIDLINK